VDRFAATSDLERPKNTESNECRFVLCAIAHR
jgi:hypothetical protein